MIGGTRLQSRGSGVQRPVPLYDALPSVIASIGYPDFPARLFDAFRGVTDSTYITVFVSGQQPKARLLVAENEGDPGVCQKSANLYLSRYWNQDPANRVVVHDPDIHTLHIAATDIASTAYRSACYHALGLAKRFSLIQSRRDETMRVNLYFRTGAGLQSVGFDQVSEHSRVLMAAIWRHYDHSASLDGTNATNTFRTRLERAAPSLSPRELDVCSLIATGITSEGIAARLGVGINTVLTYRKRAYARLNISSQNELMRFLM